MMLSKTEFKIYQELASSGVFTLKQFKKVASKYTKQWIPQLLSRMKKKGFLVGIRRGIYARVPADYVGRGYWPDPLDVAETMAEAKGGWLSHHSALHALQIDTTSTASAYVSSFSPFRNIEFGGRRVVWVRPPKALKKPVLLELGKYRLPFPEEVLVDCIDAPSLAGGIDAVIDGFSTFDGPFNPKAALKRVEAYGKKCLYNKVGFSLDLLKDDLGLNADALKGFHKKVGEKTVYLDPASGSGRYVNKWNIIVPESVFLEWVSRSPAYGE